MDINKNYLLEDLPNEVWKDVVGYEGLYMVSNLSRVKKVKRFSNVTRVNKDGRVISFNIPIKEAILKQNINCKGYYTLQLTKNSFPKTVTTHRLVAKAFLPNPENKPAVNHIDGVKTNNNVENLEWVTLSENVRHAHANNLACVRVGSDNSFAKLSEEDIINIRKTYKEGGFTHKSLGEIYNTHSSNIGLIVNHKAWKHI